MTEARLSRVKRRSVIFLLEDATTADDVLPGNGDVYEVVESGGVDDLLFEGFVETAAATATGLYFIYDSPDGVNWSQWSQQGVTLGQSSKAFNLDFTRPPARFISITLTFLVGGPWEKVTMVLTGDVGLLRRPDLDA